jgi:hypothetical protein
VVDPRRLQLVVRYSAPLDAQAAAFQTIVPLGMLRPYTPPDADPAWISEIATAVAAEINDWAARRTLATGARYVIDLGLFATLSAISQPVVALPELRLALADIAPATLEGDER